MVYDYPNSAIVICESDIYDAVCNYAPCTLSPAEQLTHHALLLGKVNKDFRCILASYFWEEDASLHTADLLPYDGQSLKQEKYEVRTYHQADIEQMVLKAYAGAIKDKRRGVQINWEGEPGKDLSATVFTTRDACRIDK